MIDGTKEKAKDVPKKKRKTYEDRPADASIVAVVSAPVEAAATAASSPSRAAVTECPSADKLRAR